MNIKFKKLYQYAKEPKFQNSGDVCADLCASEDVTLIPGKHVTIGTGIAIGLESGWEAQIRPRSGLAAKYGISIVNSPGTIDSGYRGEIKVIMLNNGENKFIIKTGDRIAQIAVREVPFIEFTEVEELTETPRGENGLGSTGGFSIQSDQQEKSRTIEV